MISGLSFADHCKWVVDPRYPHRSVFRYDYAVTGDWVFINGDYLQWFVAQLPFLVLKKFTFIIHNTDRSFGQYELQLLLPHALRVYAINTTIRHPILTTIPIGFVDKQLPFLQSFQPVQCERDIDIYMNFTTVTNSIKRKECADAFANNARVVSREGLSVAEYYNDLCRSKFVLCPEGTGMDTHRVYESLVCGATPVVLRNSLSHLYERLPVCIIDKWTDAFYIPNKPFHTDPNFYLQRT